MQIFLGFTEFRAKVPFDPTLLVFFRKRLNCENVANINEVIVKVTPPEPEKADTMSDHDDDNSMIDPMVKNNRLIS